MRNFPLPNRRILNLVGALACVALLVSAYVFQFFVGLDPCPLCIFQRLGVLVLGLVFLAAAIQHPGISGARIYAGLLLLAALAGGGVSAWHLWLQHLPPGEAPTCGPGLDYMLEAFPLMETIKMVFTASGECAEVAWRFLGLSMPGWVLLCFASLGSMGIWVNVTDRDGGTG